MELGVPLDRDDADRQRIAAEEDDRIEEAMRRRGGKAGKGVEDIHREVIRKRRHESNDDYQKELELKEELELEESRREVNEAVEKMILARHCTNQGKTGEMQMKEQDRTTGQNVFRETNTALDEASSLRSYFGAVLHQANEAARHEAEEAEREKRLYYLKRGIDDDGWTGKEQEETRDPQNVDQEEEPKPWLKRRRSLRGILTNQIIKSEEEEMSKKRNEEDLARKGLSSGQPHVNANLDITEEDIYDHSANEER